MVGLRNTRLAAVATDPERHLFCNNRKYGVILAFPVGENKKTPPSLTPVFSKRVEHHALSAILLDLDNVAEVDRNGRSVSAPNFNFKVRVLMPYLCDDAIVDSRRAKICYEPTLFQGRTQTREG